MWSVQSDLFLQNRNVTSDTTQNPTPSPPRNSHHFLHFHFPFPRMLRKGGYLIFGNTKSNPGPPLPLARQTPGLRMATKKYYLNLLRYVGLPKSLVLRYLQNSSPLKTGKRRNSRLESHGNRPKPHGGQQSVIAR